MSELIPHIIASAILFILVWTILGRLVFRPFFAFLAEREARTTGDEHAAVEKRKELKALEAKIEEALRVARIEGMQIRDELILEAKKEAQSISELAYQQATEQLANAGQAIEKLKTQAYADLPGEAEQLAKVVVARALSAAEVVRTIH